MCIESKLNDEQREVWLKTQPDIITAYKVVVTDKYRYSKLCLYSIFSYGDERAFKRKNRLKVAKRDALTNKRSITENGSKYVAYYHVFAHAIDASMYCRSWTGAIVVECTVPKKYITDIGYQEGVVIITRGFDIIGQDEYLE